MTPPAAPPRKRNSGSKPAKAAPEGTIRVAKRIVVPPTPPPAPQAVAEEPEQLAPGLPCSGRCGHCNHHPCRLHGGV